MILIITKLLSSPTYYIEACEWHCQHSSTITSVDGLGHVELMLEHKRGVCRVILDHDGVRLLAFVGGKAT